MKKFLVIFWVRNNYREPSRKVGVEVWADSADDACLALAVMYEFGPADFEAEELTT
jgi:hypothetical protein